jgi:LysR family glycine cleavage system transcriptional activator
LKRLPLVHDDMLVDHCQAPSWPEWFRTANVEDVDAGRGLRFNSIDHALDAAAEGAGVLLVHDLLAYDALRTGQLVIPVALRLRPSHAYYFVYPKSRRDHPHVQAFRAWIKEELAALDWRKLRASRR